MSKSERENSSCSRSLLLLSKVAMKVLPLYILILSLLLLSNCAHPIKTDLKVLNTNLHNLLGKIIEVRGKVIEQHLLNTEKKGRGFFFWTLTLEKEGERFSFQEEGYNPHIINRAIGLVLKANKEGSDIMITAIVKKEGIDLKTIVLGKEKVSTDAEDYIFYPHYGIYFPHYDDFS